MTNLSFQDETFDFVLCEDGPISISDSKQVVRELVRVLKKEKFGPESSDGIRLSLIKRRQTLKRPLNCSKAKQVMPPIKG
ncbi:MAG: methyltransferase domain-containing protein [Deltaproteobacteria bacterium]|nr:methyltransferase domain-containing protein [Deltaproteobacteria bacterium]MBW2052566.1 methyltransferase domain-containing protein [Deltaproteobacteria bacterium]MBW2141826.1 methyltransferase domain-containing protein [Deltaproteobacteria bacterium]MBW2324704.1 methyltransferase domain-containing protein [Deltaproteobacteria bacterium]